MPTIKDSDLIDFFIPVFNQALKNCVLIMDSNGKAITVNPAFTKSFGYSETDIAGKDVTILFTPEDRAAGMPEKELSHVLSHGQSNDNNYLVAKNGIRTWVSGESVLMQRNDGSRFVIKLIQDIHEKKEAEQALARLHQFNENILSAICDAVLVVDEQLQIVKLNSAAAELFPVNTDKTVTLDVESHISPYDKDGLLLNNIKEGFTGKKCSNLLVELTDTKNEKKIFSINGTTLTTAAGIHLLLVLHDVTLFKQLEREREDIIGFVAHELRNPLSNIGFCNELFHLMVREQKYDELPPIIRRCENNILRLNKMIGELYNATKISSGTPVLDITTYHFGEMINESVDTINNLHPSYIITIQGESNFNVEGDRYRMMEVVNNFLCNGIKYSNGNMDIRLTIQKDVNSVTVAVKDYGLGIAAHQLPFIFDRFFRAEKTRNLEGLGLGLYLCQRIIKAHTGKVWAESEEEKGSTFYFSVPLKISPGLP
jgi:PAS domain S-box-containing protein